MKIVGVCACTVGIAHTYMAQEKLEKAAEKAGIEAKFETQGSIGRENALTEEEIKEADLVILAIDVKIAGLLIVLQARKSSRFPQMLPSSHQTS